MEKKFRDIKEGDTFYYLPGRVISEPGDTVTRHIVSRVTKIDGILYVFCDDFFQGKSALFNYPENELNSDTFMDKYGYYSRVCGGIEKIINERIDQEIATCHRMIKETTEKYQKCIEQLEKERL